MTALLNDNDHPDVPDMAAMLAGYNAAQLRAFMATAAGLHAHRLGLSETIDALNRITLALRPPEDVRLLALRRLSMTEITKPIAEAHGVTLADLQGPSKVAHLARARQEVMHSLHKTGRWSSVQIGRFLGGRDHATILYGVRRHAWRMAQGARETNGVDA